MDQTTISILGCGWLGLPLSEFLISKNYIINGSSRTKQKFDELNDKSINPFLINLPEGISQNENSDFFNSDVLIINIPPLDSKSDGKIFPHDEQIKLLAKKINSSSVKKIIYISSTSVYLDTNGVVTEESNYASSVRAETLLKAEANLKNSEFDLTILRFGGLYGYGRIPIRKNSNPVILGNFKKLNLLHRDNACRVILEIIEKDLWNETFNVCEDEHPTQLEFFHQSAACSEIDNYEVDNSKTDYKIVSNFKIRNALGISLTNKIPQS
ncbi:MAG: hypothetical protein ACEPO8_02890 [Rhodothermaceae bacterium]